MGNQQSSGNSVASANSVSTDATVSTGGPLITRAPISTDGRCGVDFENKRCPGTQCCSKYGWCGGERGKPSDWCATNNRGVSDGKFDGK